MTDLQKIQKRLSESRESVNELSMKADRSEAEETKLTELRTKHTSVEKEYREALEATTDPKVIVRDGETREFDEILSRSTVGRILTSALSQRATDGAEAELQAHFGLTSNQVPLEMLETRAVTPAPSDVGASQQPIIPAIFPDGVASFLGVGMPTVGVGEATYTVLTTGATVHTPAKSADAAETTGAFSASVLSPKRAQASFFWAIEDEARLAGMEDALRTNLTQALSSKFDNILLNDSTAGLLGGGLTAPSDPSDVVDWPGYKKLLTDQVDGHYASMPDQVRMLIGSKTYAHQESLYRVLSTAGGVNESSYELLVRKSGGVRISSHVVAPSANIQGLIAVRRPSAVHAVMPIWRGVTLIPDRITKAASGQVQLTAVALYGLAVLRSAGFGRLKVKLA